jgi:hypothetical protein
MKRSLREVLRIAREVPAFASRHKVWAGIVIALALLAVVIYLPKAGFVRPGGALTAAERARAESDFRGHLITALGGLVLAAGAYFTGRTFALNREGQITERFTRAVEQLADEKLDIRLGGIYALERIARDSETHYEPVIEVLTAFLREHAGRKLEIAASGEVSVSTADVPPDPLPRVDFQAAATVIGRRDRRHERPDYRLDLHGVGLAGASLCDAHLEDADLRFAMLYGADLTGADLSGAFLSSAHLSEADLGGAVLTRAYLPFANLTGTFLGGVIGLTHEQLAQAIMDEETTLPEYLDREAGG